MNKLSFPFKNLGKAKQQKSGKQKERQDKGKKKEMEQEGEQCQNLVLRTNGE